MSNIKQATALAWVVSCLLSTVLTAATFLFLIDQDRWGPEGFSSGFTVSELPQDLSADQFIHTLNSASVSNSVNIYKVAPSSVNDSRATDYYLFKGDPSQVIGDPDSGAFPTFARFYQATLHDASHLEKAQLTGTYLVQGSSVATQSIISSLAHRGVTAQSFSAQPGYLLWGFFLIGSGWGTATTILGLLLLLTLCQLQSVRLTVVAVRLSSGDSRKRVRLLETLALVVPAYSPLIVWATTLALYSLIVSDGYRLLSLIAITLQQFIALTLLVIASIIAVTIYSSRQSLGELIKGKRPEALLSAVSTALIMVAALGTTSAVSHAWKQVQEYGAAEQADTIRLSQPDLVQPIVGYALQSSQAEQVSTSMGNIFIELEQSEHSFLAAPGVLFDAQKNSSVPDNNMAVNPTYLSAFTDIDQQTIQNISQLAAQKSTVVALIPSQYTPVKDDIRASIESWAQFKHNPDNPHQADITVETITHIDTGVIPLLKFNLDTHMYLKNPVLIVVSPASDVLPAKTWGTLDTVYQAKPYQSAVSANNLDFAVIGYDYVAQQTHLAQTDRKASLIIVLIGATVALGTLVICTILLVRVYENRNRTAIFLQVTSGARFTEIHGIFLRKIFLIAAVALSISIAISPLPAIGATLISLIALITIILVAILTLQGTQKLTSRFMLEIS